MRNFYLIRFDSLVSDRIGHFSGNIELYCCERDAGINVPDTAYVDLFFHSGKPCNKQLDIMWRREIIIVPGLIGVVLSLTLRVINIINNMFPGVNKHVISGAARSDRDIHNLLDETPQHLKFTQKEQLRGEEWLSANGITTNSKIVLLMVRDSTYLKHKYPDKDWSYHDYRDSSINNFVKVSSALASRGYYVIRMGQHVDEKLQVEHPLVIDYATNGMRTDFMDIYLSSICDFVVSTGTGIDAPASLCFRKPIVYVNYAPIGYLFTFSSNFLLLAKHYVLKNENRILSLSEIFSRDVGFCLKKQCFEDNGIKLIENNPKDIIDIVMEMSDRLENTWISEVNDEILQDKFWDIFPIDSKAYNNVQLHGKIKARYGSVFLRNNTLWLS